MDKLVEEVMARLRRESKKKALLIIRGEDLDRDYLESFMEALGENDILPHICLGARARKDIEGYLGARPYEIVPWEGLDPDRYIGVFIDYIRLEEVLALLNLRLEDDFSQFLFRLVYRNKKIYTTIDEFKEPCENPYLARKIGAIYGELEEMNIRARPRAQLASPTRGPRGELVGERVIGLSHVYQKGYREVVVARDAIVTNAVEDYLRENKIGLRRI